MKNLFFTLFLLSLIGCNQQEVVYQKSYFDFDSLFNAQEDHLLKVRSSITKKVWLDGVSEDVSFLPDSMALHKELEVFRQLDVINKPGFKDQYKISDREKDNRSNLLIRKYYTTDPAAPVTFVHFYYQNEFPRLHKIEAGFKEENTLYSTQYNLLLEFDDHSGSHLLSKYKLTGVQKMILNDTTSFSVEGLLVPGIF